MKVAFVINSLGAGGSERSTALMLPVLRDRGVDPVVFTLKREPVGDEDRIRDLGIPVTVLAATSWFGRVRELRRLLRAERPDVVHTAIFDADVVGRVAAFGTRVPVISSLVNTPYDPVRFTDPKVRKWRLRVLKAVDGVTGRWMVDRFHSVSEGVATANIAALRLRPDRVTVIDRGRPTEQLGEPGAERRAAVRGRLGVNDHTVVVLAVGRQEFQKAHADLIAAMHLAQPRLAEAVLLVAGRAGNATPEIEAALAAAPGTASSVHLLGHRDDIGDLLAAADVFAMPSRYEGTAGAALEAMAMSVPIVATAVDGLRGVLVDDVNAVLVPVGDRQALADAIVSLATDRERAARLAERAKADFDERFRLDRAVAAMEQLYRSTARAVRG